MRIRLQAFISIREAASLSSKVRILAPGIAETYRMFKDLSFENDLGMF
jgi:hypothetical protein